MQKITLESEVFIAVEGPKLRHLSFLDQKIDIIYSQGGEFLIWSFDIKEKSTERDKCLAVHTFNQLSSINSR